ncbi:MAG: Fur family transcriptional regulator [Hyphomicrobium sp.]|jgi:Fur family zinc uptake transcriptional regulator
MNRKVSKRRAAPEQDKMIVEALRVVGRPVSAYELIEELRDKASLAPQTVYRSLDRLIADGQAHRLESINAFVACRHPSHESVAAFAICDDCGTVTEFDEPSAVERLATWARESKFAVDRMTLELRGRCQDCRARVSR